MVELPDDETIQAWVRNKPTNHRELLEHLATLFHAWIGPPRAYVDVPLEPITTTFCDDGTDIIQPTVWRLVFTVVGVEATGKREAVEADLVARFMVPFLAARILGLELLIWRRPPALIVQGQTVRLECRVHIPGFDLTEYRAPWIPPHGPTSLIFSTTSSLPTENEPTRS